MKPATWLSLAAAPTFTVMAAVTAILDAKAGGALCGPRPGSPLSAMVVMYLLMAGVHMAPWLRRLER